MHQLPTFLPAFLDQLPPFLPAFLVALPPEASKAKPQVLRVEELTPVSASVLEQALLLEPEPEPEPEPQVAVQFSWRFLLLPRRRSPSGNNHHETACHHRGCRNPDVYKPLDRLQGTGWLPTGEAVRYSSMGLNRSRGSGSSAVALEVV